MIALCYCLNSWCQSDTTYIFSKGEADSVLVSYNDLRVANAKMTELKYEKAINDSLRKVIVIDNTLIESYRNQSYKYETEVNKTKRERNLATILGVAGTLVGLTIAIVK